MVAQFSPIPNSIHQRRALAGTEVTRGGAVVPEFKLYGDLQINDGTRLATDAEADGTFDDSGPPTFGPPSFDGTYALQKLSYQDLAMLPRYAVAGGVAGVGDSEATEGFLYEYSPTASVDDLDSMTVLYGIPGIIERSTGVMFDEFTISGNVGDAIDAWHWNGRLFVRDQELQLDLAEVALTAVTGGAGSAHVLTPAGGGLTIDALIGQYVEIMSGPGAGQVALIADNDATTITLDRDLTVDPTTASTIAVSGEFTAGISDRDRDVIRFAGSRLFIGEEGDDLDEHQIRGRFKAFSLTVANAMNPKQMAEDVDSFSPKVDRGKRLVTAQVTAEYDEFREVVRWKGRQRRGVRIDQPNGPTIDAGAGTQMAALIDLPYLMWESRDGYQVRNNNILVTYGGRGFVDSDLSYSYLLSSFVDLAALPGD